MDRAAQHALVVSTDPALPGEVDSALSELRSARWIVHAEKDPRRGVEVARDRQPQLVFLELTSDTHGLKMLAEDVGTASPDSIIVVSCQPEDLRRDESAAFLIDIMRARVSDFLRRPLSATEVDDTIRRHLREPSRRSESSTQGKIISFMSNKGGVGKSTLSVSVATRLAMEHPDRVLLIDASLQLGTCASMLDLMPPSTIADAAREVERLDTRLLRTFTQSHESGLRLLSAPASAVDAARIDDLAISRILQVGRKAFDYVVVDTFPMIDSVAVAILDLSDLLYAVVNTMVPAVLGAERLLDVLEGIGLPRSRRRVILNENQPSFRGKLRPIDVAERLGTDLDFVIPFRKQLLVGMNTGAPYALTASRWSVLGRTIQGIVSEIEALQPAGTRARDGDVVDRLSAAINQEERNERPNGTTGNPNFTVGPQEA